MNENECTVQIELFDKEKIIILNKDIEINFIPFIGLSLLFDAGNDEFIELIVHKVFYNTNENYLILNHFIDFRESEEKMTKKIINFYKDFGFEMFSGAEEYMKLPN